MLSIVSFTLSLDPPARLDKAIARDVPDAEISRSRLMKLFEAGAVRMNGKVVGPKDKPIAEAKIDITLPDPVDSHILPEDIALDIVHEDDSLIVINKPAGMVVHPAPGTPSGTLVNALLYHFDGALSGVGGVKRPGVVHRIDKDTTGLLVVAKSDAAHQSLAAQFAAHTARRRYDAICYGVPDSADPRLGGLRGVSFEKGGLIKITSHLARHKTDRQRQAVLFGNGRHAVTRVKLEQPLADGGAALVSCRLETGRTHQIRVHMSYVGHGLIGDATYSSRRKLKGTWVEAGLFDRQALHAAELGFVHPDSGEELVFHAVLPPDMAALRDRLS